MGRKVGAGVFDGLLPRSAIDSSSGGVRKASTEAPNNR